MKVDFVALPSKIVANETTLKCPKCNDEHLHFSSASIHRKMDKTTVSNEAITINEEENKTRGFTITFVYHCENGHHGELIFQFHEGIIYVNHKPLPAKPDFKDIWRD